MEGYVLHTYGSERYVRHAVASVVSLRRHDHHRPVALYCPPEHREYLELNGLDHLFAVIEPLPEAHQSIVGFKHHLDLYMPFERSLFVDADMIWCRNPDPLWKQLSGFSFTATGLERADFFFGGPKGAGVLWDILFDRRRKTLVHFGLTHLPRVQAGMIYASDVGTCELVCETARHFLARRDETHFRSRLDEGRSEESCEWSLAMAMSRLELPVIPWLQGYNSPQLDYIEGLTTYDDDFEIVRCTYYTDRFLYQLRGVKTRALREFLIALISSLPGRGDVLIVTPFVLHFGWLHYKTSFYRFADRTWKELAQPVPNEEEMVSVLPAAATG